MTSDTSGEQSTRERLSKLNQIINVQGNEFVKYEGLLDEAHRQGLCRINTVLIQVPHDDNGQCAIVSAEVEVSKGVFSGIGDAAPSNVGRMIAPHIIRMAETRAKARALRDAVNIGVTAIEELGDLDSVSDRGIGRSDDNGSSERSSRSNARTDDQGVVLASERQCKMIFAVASKLGHEVPSTSGLDKATAERWIKALKEEEAGGKIAVLVRETSDSNGESSQYRSDVPKASPYKAASANQLATIAKLSRLLGEPEEPDENLTSAEASDRITELSREYNERKGGGGWRS